MTEEPDENVSRLAQSIADADLPRVTAGRPLSAYAQPLSTLQRVTLPLGLVVMAGSPVLMATGHGLVALRQLVGGLVVASGAAGSRYRRRR